MGKYEDYKKTVLDCTMSLVEHGFLTDRGGNVSICVEGEEIIAVTPSQVPYTQLKLENICVVDFDLNPVEDNGLRPSVETGMHISVYKNRKDINAVIHTHQVFASVFSIISEPIPAIYDEVSRNVGNVIEVVSYGLSGSPQLLENITAKLDNRCNCYILQNHGALSLGTTMFKARENAELLEKSAQTYYYALTTGKEIALLPENIQNLMTKILEGEQNAEIQRKEEAKK